MRVCSPALCGLAAANLPYFYRFLGVLVLFLPLEHPSRELGTLQPNRILAPAYLVLVIPAALGIGDLFEWALATDNTVAHLARFALVALALIAGVVINEVRREVSYDNIGHYGVIPPEVRGLGQTGSVRWPG